MKTLQPARAIWLIGALLIATLTGACAGPPVPPTPAAAATPAPSATRPPTTTPRPTATLTPQPTPTPAPQALRLWVGETGEALGHVRALVADYRGASGAPITIIAKSPDTLRLSAAGLALTGEAPPDLIWADGETLAGLLADGQLRPVTATGDPLPGLLEGASAEGALWGVPLTGQGSLLLLYNRQLVAGGPATSDELIVRSRAGGAGLVMAWDEPRWLVPWLYGFGGAVTGGADGGPTLDTPEMISALNLLSELAIAGPDVVKTYRGGQRWFGEGEVAFSVDGDWVLPEYRALSDTLDLGVAPLPLIPATGRRALPLLSGSYLMLWHELDGQELARAEELAAFLEQPETQARLASALGRLPASRQALADPLLRADPALAAAAQMAAAAPGLPPTQAARCALFGIDVWLPSLLRGRLDPAETATNMQREAEACVTR